MIKSERKDNYIAKRKLKGELRETVAKMTINAQSASKKAANKIQWLRLYRTY